jgi:hypothetical protein
MITDTEIKMKGIRVLIESLGEVEAERFIALMQREPFDHTKWQRSLWAESMSVTQGFCLPLEKQWELYLGFCSAQ